MKTVDVVIIGAGPAGSVCGSLLKRAGVDCVIIDHADFPRDKVCGGGLTVKAWRLLDSLLPGLTYDFRPHKPYPTPVRGRFRVRV
jgi:flavin-dependent dehydrogenase